MIIEVKITGGTMLVDDDVWLRFLLTVNRSVWIGPYGYCIFRYQSIKRFFHCWVMDYPVCMVGHLNSVKSHNFVKNLYLCTREVNGKNLNDPVQSNNTSGIRGVYFHLRDQKWVAEGRNKGIHTQLGYFESKELAIKARREYEQENGFYTTRPDN